MSTDISGPKAEAFFTDGCGRCSLGGTPACKVHAWREPLLELRRLILGCGLTEERKWGVPCYTKGGTNVLMLGAFKESCTLSFLKGVLLTDPEGLLTKPGVNSQSARLVRFTDISQVHERRTGLQSLIREAVLNEEKGVKVARINHETNQLPEELERKMNEIPALKVAFEALTPGRQRGYLLYFNGAKQSKTKEARIEKCLHRILAGKGLMD